MRQALVVESLSVNYDKTPALWDLDLTIPEGKLVAIIGPNGAGKSTFLKSILGLVRPLSGCVRFFGQPYKAVRQKIAYVPQKESVDWTFPITVEKLVMMGRYPKMGLFALPRKEDKAAVRKVLAQVQMEEYADRQISQLSGGQQQRAFLARALIQEADLYLLDEPFGGIDAASTQLIGAIFKELCAQNKTLLVVHHDLQSVEPLYDWVFLLNMRQVALGPTQEVFTEELLQRTFGTQNVLLESVAKLSQAKSEGY